MMHGIYVRTGSKGKWLLKQTARNYIAAETSKKELEKYYEYIHQDKAEIAIQLFGSRLEMPEILSSLSPYKAMLN